MATYSTMMIITFLQLFGPRCLATAYCDLFLSSTDTVIVKVASDQFAIPPTHRKGIKQIVNYHFRPMLPFVMLYLQIFVAGPQICIHTRV